MKRKSNPFPKPRLTSSGSSNRWAIEDIAAWENSESEKAAA
jgi:predicted DNA-binding transcriptional regulator AlpA